MENSSKRTIHKKEKLPQAKHLGGNDVGQTDFMHIKCLRTEILSGGSVPGAAGGYFRGAADFMCVVYIGCRRNLDTGV